MRNNAIQNIIKVFIKYKTKGISDHFPISVFLKEGVVVIVKKNTFSPF